MQRFLLGLLAPLTLCRGWRISSNILVMPNDILRFAQINFRNDRRVFGIKREDRFSHIYIVGKTGTGKSTLLEMMALQDLALGNGFALIDPHGDLVERIAAQVPERRRSEVIYFDAPSPT